MGEDPLPSSLGVAGGLRRLTSKVSNVTVGRPHSLAGRSAYSIVLCHVGGFSGQFTAWLLASLRTSEGDGEQDQPAVFGKPVLGVTLRHFCHILFEVRH